MFLFHYRRCVHASAKSKYWNVWYASKQHDASQQHDGPKQHDGDEQHAISTTDGHDEYATTGKRFLYNELMVYM